MTRPKASRYPVSSFNPQLLGILIRGSRERVEIPCPDQRTMKWLQARIQMLRTSMQHENHPQYPLVTRARTSRSWDTTVGEDANCVLSIQPHDLQFESILTAAGFPLDDHDRDLLADVEAPKFSLDDEIASVPDPYAKFK